MLRGFLFATLLVVCYNPNRRKIKLRAALTPSETVISPLIAVETSPDPVMKVDVLFYSQDALRSRFLVAFISLRSYSSHINQP